MRPVIPITLIHKGVSVESEAIVDSGSGQGFFDKFSVKFNLSKELIELKEIK